MRVLWYGAAAAGVGLLAFVASMLLRGDDVERERPMTAQPPPVAAAPPSMAAIKEARRRELMTARPVEYPRAIRDNLVRALGGEEVVALLRSADRVEAVLLKVPESPQTTPPHEYEPSTEAVAVEREVAAHIVEVLLDPQLHRVPPKGSAKGCYPVYGVRLSYWTGEDRIDLYLCFQCDDVAIMARGQYVPYAQVAFGVDALLGDVLKIFPDDPALNELAGRAAAANLADPYGRPSSAPRR